MDAEEDGVSGLNGIKATPDPPDRDHLGDSAPWMPRPVAAVRECGRGSRQREGYRYVDRAALV